MIELFYLAFLLLVSIALGQRILKLLKIKFYSNLEELVFSLPLGLAVLAYATFFLGIMGLLYKSVLILLVALLYLALLRDVKRLLLQAFKSIKEFSIRKIAAKYSLGFNFFSISIIFLLVFAALNFIASFSPPWHFDVLAYHLAVPKIYIKAHQIVYIPYIFYSNLPSLVNTIYLMGLLLYNGILSNLLGYSLGIVFILAIFSFCRRFFNLKTAILSSLIFYSFPLVFMMSRTSHVDVQFALFLFLALYGLFAYLESNDGKWLVLCSIFAGFGVSSKIFGAVAAFGIFILLVWHLMSRLAKHQINYGAVFSRIAVFFLIVAVITMPWLLKNYFFTGNPVWPAFDEIFHGKYWNQQHQDGLKRMLYLREPTIMNYIRIPWDIHTQSGKKFGNIDEDLEIGPFFLAFVPLYFILKKNSIINKFFVLLFVYLTIWFFYSHIFRYVIFAVPLVAIISAYVIVELLKSKSISFIIKTLLVLTFSFSLMFWFGANLKELPVALGIESQNDFHLKYPGPIYTASEFVNSNLPENSRILLFRDTRGFFLERDYVWADPLYQAYIDYTRIKNEDDFYRELKKLGVTHILVNENFGWKNVLHDVITSDYRYTERILALKDNLLKKYTINLYKNGGISVNELK